MAISFRKLIKNTLRIFVFSAGVALSCLAAIYTEQNLRYEEVFVEVPAEEVTREFVYSLPDPLEIYIPRCDSINYKLKEQTCDFSYTNPQNNSCYLRVSITRTDTSQTLYTSPLISPGNSVSDIILFPAINRPGTYAAMIKTDAYALDKMSHLNSLVAEASINVQ
ncbi:MAG: hypothetical protein IKV97_05585 [Clostridia bacterium]|nr:hypothetical protein [Clostridia bacterium]